MALAAVAIVVIVAVVVLFSRSVFNAPPRHRRRR